MVRILKLEEDLPVPLGSNILPNDSRILRFPDNPQPLIEKPQIIQVNCQDMAEDPFYKRENYLPGTLSDSDKFHADQVSLKFSFLDQWHSVAIVVKSAKSSDPCLGLHLTPLPYFPMSFG